MNVAFRVDASPQIGAGHVMRCAALADALRERGATIRFVCRELPAHVRDMLVERGFEVVEISGETSDAADTARALAGQTWDWLVVDHYELDVSWETRLRSHARRILAIDDLANRPHDCNVLLDQNVHPRMTERYTGKVPSQCEMLLGPRYALLRDEFRRARAKVSARNGSVQRVLVSFGGADADNYTEPAVEALRECLAGLKVDVDVIVPAGHPKQREIEEACRQSGFACHVQTRCMADLMAKADLAVGAAGSTTWERCCMGLPSLAVSVAPNQHEVAQEAARRGLVYLVPTDRATPTGLAMHLRALLESTPLREMLSRNGMQAVDGGGAGRVARVLDRHSIRMRQATLADADALFEWRNDDEVRSGARRSDPIPRTEHDAWLRSVLADDNRLLLIGERNGIPIGVVRLDVSGAQAEMSLYRVPRSSSETGLASNVMLAAIDWLRANRPDLERLTGEVLGPNERSHHLVQSTGWVLHSSHYTRPLRTS